MDNLLVMKFGGTSVGSAERIGVAACLTAEQYRQRPVAIVVSAMAGITNLLLETLGRAKDGDSAGVASNIERLREHHARTCRELLPPDRHERVLAAMNSAIDCFERIAGGITMLGEAPPRSVDEALAVGERLSVTLIAECLETHGVKAEAVDAANVIVTDAVFGNATPLMGATRERARARLLPMLAQGVLPVVTGFNGATEDGRPTTLGRGGSDFSASILASALDASELWIWTDVDGIMTADPRIVPDCAVLDEVTYREAAELAYNGAKVLHPRTLAPLIEKGIPVWSKNSFAPDKPGTKIVPRIADVTGARAVTSMSNVALISIEPASTVINATQVMARALDGLGRSNVEVLALSSSSYTQSLCFLVRTAELGTALASLNASLALELAHGYIKPVQVDENVGLLAVVGEGMRGTAGLAGRIFTAISRERINIKAIAQGSSELTIAIVVRKDGLEKAVRAVHEETHLADNEWRSGA
jgi:aspartokinase/homoserine dehydrogenase 1